MTERPYVGLRPFQQDESLLFFGRRQQIAELMDRLHDTRFLAIVGSSGCGKSSLIRAGLMPRLEAGFLVENRDRWFFATLTPGGDPLDRLAASFEIPAAALAEEGAFAITARLAASDTSGDRNCFILVDQFEELFRFAAANRDQAADFVQILLSLVSQRDFPVFVAITMRSDFLGECDAFTGLPEALNRSQYFVPRLNRQQRREAIEGPVKLFRQSMTPRLLDRLINDVGDEPGQLPVLQHALLRTWERWTEAGAAGPLDLPHYEAIGGVQEALSRDAEAALLPGSAALAERIFRRLTTTDAANRRIRRPALLGELEAVTGSSRAEVLAVLAPFRARSFVVVYERPGGDHLIDISHESLIAQWVRLKQWVDAEAESKRVYLDLVAAVERKKALLHDADLQVALDWRRKLDPRTERAWALDLHPAYPQVVAYLDESVAEDERGERRRRRQLWLMWSLGGALLLVSLILLPFAWSQLENARVAKAIADVATANAEEAARAATESRNTADKALEIAAVSRDAASAFEKEAKATLVRAENDARVALAVRLGAEAQRIEITPERPDDNELRAMLGAQSLRIAPTFEGLNALLEVLVKLPRRPRHFALPGSPAAMVIVFSPNRGQLASGHRDGKVFLWNIESGKVERELGTAPGPVYSLAFDSEGKQLAAGAQRGIVVFSIASSANSTIPTRNVAKSVSFHPDGELLAAVVQADETIVCKKDSNSGGWPCETIQDPYKDTVFFDAKGVLFRRGLVREIETLPDAGMDRWVSMRTGVPEIWREGMTAGSFLDHRPMNQWMGPKEQGGAYNPFDRLAATPGQPDGIDVWDGRIGAYSDPVKLDQEVEQLRAVPGTRSFLAMGSQGGMFLIDAPAAAARALPAPDFRPDSGALHPSLPLVALWDPDGNGAVLDFSRREIVWRWRNTGSAGVTFNPSSNRLYIQERGRGADPGGLTIVTVGAWTRSTVIPMLARDVARIDSSGQRIAIEHRRIVSRAQTPADVITIFDARGGSLLATLQNPGKDAAQEKWPLLFSEESRRPEQWYMQGFGLVKQVIDPTLANGLVVALPLEMPTGAAALTDDHAWAATGTGKVVNLWPLDPPDVLKRACGHFLARNMDARQYQIFRIPEKFRVPACPNLQPAK